MIAFAGTVETVRSVVNTPGQVDKPNKPQRYASGIAKLMGPDGIVTVPVDGVLLVAVNGCTSPKQSVALAGVTKKLAGKGFMVNFLVEGADEAHCPFPLATKEMFTKPACNISGAWRISCGSQR